MALNLFYWLYPDVLAGGSRPGGRDDRAEALDDDLRWLRAQGIGAVLSLTEAPLAEAALARHGLESLHLPVPDLSPPSPPQFLDALDFIDAQRARGRAVVVHCLVGEGRTATVLAAHLIRDGVPVDEAITRLRGFSAGAIGSPAQEEALAAFAARRDWII